MPTVTMEMLHQKNEELDTLIREMREMIVLANEQGLFANAHQGMVTSILSRFSEALRVTE